MAASVKQIEEIAYHRNGVGGQPFYVVAFTNEDDVKMVGVVFAYAPDEVAGYDPETSESDAELWKPSDRVYRNPRTAVFDREALGKGVIAFGENSWRGDRYDDDLRAAIVKEMGS